MTDVAQRIPNDICFFWVSNPLPYGAYLSIKSAALRGRPDSIRLYKTPDVDASPHYQRLLREVECLRPVNIDLPAWLEEAALPCTKELLAAHAFCQERKYHSAVSDLLRAVRLYLDGGMYLDTDVLVLRDLASLRTGPAFLTEEHILVSSRIFKRNSPWRYFRTGPLTLARDLCAKLSCGVTIFQAISPLYVRAVHNAVMGFRPGYPLMRDALLRIAERYPDRPRRYSLLGPDTLQDLIAERTYDGLTIFPPETVSPLGPTMTYQYFRHCSPKRLEKMQRQIVGEQTHAIHWSGNATIAQEMPKNDEDVRRMAGVQLFSRLAAQAAFAGQVPAGEGNSHIAPAPPAGASA